MLQQTAADLAGDHPMSKKETTTPPAEIRATVSFSRWLALESKKKELRMKAVQAKPLEGYRLWLKYADGTEGEVDLSDLAGRGVFQAWSDPRVFEALKVDNSGAVLWPGEIDLCPDALYLRLTGKAAEDVFPALKKTPVDA